MQLISERTVIRFAKRTIAEHAALIAVFGVLLATGLAQKYYWTSAAQWLLGVMGGIEHLRATHHMAGVLMALLGLEHLGLSVWGLAVKGQQFHMLMTLNDFRDAVHNFKYYVGMRDRQALCDRYNYKEKFVYWLVMVSGFQMLATGFVLWFPVEAARYMPGQFIPAAKAMHSNQALMMLVMLAIWHAYDSIFDPGVFPLDKSIFSGRINIERMRREHPLELMRLEGATEEDILRAKEVEALGGLAEGESGGEGPGT